MNGKGTDQLQDFAIMGDDNCSSLDCACFMDRQEFRKSGGDAWDRLHVRTCEAPGPNARLESDLWKRFITDEEIDVRVNYGFTVKRRFGNSYKAWECNFESIVCVERPGVQDTEKKLLVQLARRVICFLMTKTKFTTDPTEVDHSKGIFLAISQETLTQFLRNPVVKTLTLREWYVPIFKSMTLKDAERGIFEMQRKFPDIYKDTLWLAMRLAGGHDELPSAARGPEATQIMVVDAVIATAHAQTPNYQTIKAYLISKCDGLPGVKLSKKGKELSLCAQSVIKFIVPLSCFFLFNLTFPFG